MKPDEQLDALSEQIPEQAAESVRQLVLTGEDCAVERVLAAHASSQSDVDFVLDLVYAELLAREEIGQTCDVSEYDERFPNLADRLIRLFEVHDAFEATEAAEQDQTLSSRHDSSLAVGAADGRVGLRRIGQYELLEEIGSGATGIVFRARQRGLDRVVAVKILRPFGTAEAEARFKAEAEMTALLRHPHIVQIIEVGQDAGCHFMSMEIQEAGSLAAALGQTTFTPRAAAELVCKLAGAVAAAHDQGIVHRDLKPGNVLMSADGDPRISDFGLARHMSDASTRHTRTGAILGTPGYMAPEQVGGSGEAGPAADIYSLGAILYELLTGRPPYHGTTIAEILAQMQIVDPPPVRQLRPGVAKDLRTICMKCLQRDPDDRYASAALLVADLQRFLRGDPIEARPVGRFEQAFRWAARHRMVTLLASLVVLATLAGGSGIIWQWQRAEDGLVRASNAALAARIAEKAEQRQRVIAEKRLYRQQVIGADRELRTGASGAVLRLLQNCNPLYRGWEWQHLYASSQSATLILRGNEHGLVAVDVSPDGTLVAATGGESSDWNSRTCFVWDLRTHEKLWEHSAATMGIQQTFSPDSSRVVIAGHGHASMHDARTGELIRKYPVKNPWRGWGVAFSPDGRRFAAADGLTMRVFSADSADEGFVLQGLEESGGVHAVHYHPDGTMMAVATRNLGVTLHDPAGGEFLESLEMPADTRNVEFSPDGSLLVASGYTGFDQGCVRVWEKTPEGYSEISTRHDSAGGRSRFRFSNDGQHIAVCTEGSPISIISPRDSKVAGIYPPHQQTTRAIAFSPDSRLLVTCGDEGEVRVRDRTRESHTHLQLANPAHATDLAIHPDGRFVAMVSDNNPARGFSSFSNSVEVMDLERWQRSETFLGHQAAVRCVAWNGTGDLLASGSRDRTVRIWKPGTTEAIAVYDQHPATVVGVHFGTLSKDDAEDVVSVSENGLILRHIPGTDREPVPAETGATDVLHTDRHESLIALATSSGEVVIYDLTHRTQRRLSHRTAVHCVAFDTSGEFLCTGEASGRVGLWNLAAAEPELVWNVPLQDGVISSVDFHPSGDRLVCGGRSGPATVMDTGSGTPLLMLTPNRQPARIFRAKFDAAGRRLLATARQRLFAWDIESAPVVVSSPSPENSWLQESIVRWHQRLGWECHDSENAFGAARHFSTVGELDPEDGLCWVLAGTNLEKAKRYAEAEVALRRAVRVGLQHEQTEEWQQFVARARHELARLLITCPDEAVRNPTEGVSLCRTLLLRSPRRASYWATLTRGLEELRRGQLSETDQRP